MYVAVEFRPFCLTYPLGYTFGLPHLGTELAGVYVTPVQLIQQLFSFKLFRSNHAAKRKAKRKMTGTNKTALLISSPIKKQRKVYITVTSIPMDA